MLSEISQTEKGKYCMISLLCGIEKHQTHRNREYNDYFQGLRSGGNGEMFVRVQTFSYMSKFQGCKVQHGDCS